MQYDLQRFCIIISELRRQNGWSQTMLAEKIGISPQSVSKWECGIGYPDVTMFPVLAEVFSVPIGVLFGEKKETHGALKKEYRFSADDCKVIYVELGNVCQGVFIEDSERAGMVTIEGDPVFVRYFDVEQEDNMVTVKIKNPSGSDVHWEPYSRGGYDGENLVKIFVKPAERVTLPDTGLCKYIINYLDLVVFDGINALGQDTFQCCPME